MCFSNLDKRTLDELAYCNSRFRELTKHVEELRHERNLLNERIMEKEKEAVLNSDKVTSLCQRLNEFTEKIREGKK